MAKKKTSKSNTKTNTKTGSLSKTAQRYMARKSAEKRGKGGDTVEGGEEKPEAKKQKVKKQTPKKTKKAAVEKVASPIGKKLRSKMSGKNDRGEYVVGKWWRPARPDGMPRPMWRRMENAMNKVLMPVLSGRGNNMKSLGKLVDSKAYDGETGKMDLRKALRVTGLERKFREALREHGIGKIEEVRGGNPRNKDAFENNLNAYRSEGLFAHGRRGTYGPDSKEDIMKNGNQKKKRQKVTTPEIRDLLKSDWYVVKYGPDGKAP